MYEIFVFLGFTIFTDEVALCINCKNKKENIWDEKGEEWKTIRLDVKHLNNGTFFLLENYFLSLLS